MTCAYCHQAVEIADWPDREGPYYDDLVAEIVAEHAPDCAWVILERDGAYP